MIDIGLQVTLLTVNSKYYEEPPDNDLKKTIRQEINVIYSKAFPVTKPRFIGDIGLRAFFQLYKKARKILGEQKIDFIWIPIPSFYTALLGRLLYSRTGIPYGIDYIDPWVRDISTRQDWRHRLSNRLAKFLEPIAVKKAALISGVAYEYYRPVLERNFPFLLNNSAPNELHNKSTNEPMNQSTSELPHNHFSASPHLPINPSTRQPITHISFPYGFDPNDHAIKLSDIFYPWSGNQEVKPWIYAGAFLPKSGLFIENAFAAIAELRLENEWDDRIKLYFIGTGAYSGKSIKDYAEEHGLGSVVMEERERYPYLHILNFLSAAHTVMVIGSTEKHYTASKVYQSLLSRRPVWAVFHEESSAASIMEECQSDQYMVKYKEGMQAKELRQAVKQSLLKRLNSDEWNPDLQALEKYSAKAGAKKLIDAIEGVLEERK